MSSSVAVGRHLLDRPATAECEGRRPRASLEIKKRDDAMFAELIGPSKGRVYRLALRITRNTEDAEDVHRQRLVKQVGRQLIRQKNRRGRVVQLAHELDHLHPAQLRHRLVEHGHVEIGVVGAVPSSRALEARPLMADDLVRRLSTASPRR